MSAGRPHEDGRRVSVCCCRLVPETRPDTAVRGIEKCSEGLLYLRYAAFYRPAPAREATGGTGLWANTHKMKPPGGTCRGAARV